MHASTASRDLVRNGAAEVVRGNHLTSSRCQELAVLKSVRIQRVDIARNIAVIDPEGFAGGEIGGCKSSTNIQ